MGIPLVVEKPRPFTRALQTACIALQATNGGSPSHQGFQQWSDWHDLGYPQFWETCILKIHGNNRHMCLTGDFRQISNLTSRED